jgi:hypothetical protein
VFHIRLPWSSSPVKKRQIAQRGFDDPFYGFPLSTIQSQAQSHSQDAAAYIFPERCRA